METITDKVGAFARRTFTINNLRESARFARVFGRVGPKLADLFDEMKACEGALAEDESVIHAAVKAFDTGLSAHFEEYIGGSVSSFYTYSDVMRAKVVEHLREIYGHRKDQPKLERIEAVLALHGWNLDVPAPDAAQQESASAH